MTELKKKAEVLKGVSFQGQPVFAVYNAVAKIGELVWAEYKGEKVPFRIIRKEAHGAFLATEAFGLERQISGKARIRIGYNAVKKNGNIGMYSTRWLEPKDALEKLHEIETSSFVLKNTVYIAEGGISRTEPHQAEIEKRG